MIVRAARVTDAADLYETHVAVLVDGRGVVRSKARAPEDHARWVEDLVATPAPRAGLLVAEVDGRVVGEVELNQIPPPYCRHVVKLGIEVHPAYQRRGLGRALLEAALAWAREYGFERVELYVRADNDRAIALYRSAGFEVEGTRRRFVKLPDGSYVDDHVMGLLLAPGPATDR